MSNSLDRICTVDISLASPISNDANFDNILILGPAPANPTGDVPAIGVYNSLEELTALGIAPPVNALTLLAWSDGWLFAVSQTPRGLCCLYGRHRGQGDRRPRIADRKCCSGECAGRQWLVLHLPGRPGG